MRLEIFFDRSYYDMYALRPEGNKTFNETLHFRTQEEALFAKQVIEKWHSPPLREKNVPLRADKAKFMAALERIAGYHDDSK